MESVKEKICDEIQRIMGVYREQTEAGEYGGTPGGLEHMGDVWKLLGKWDAELEADKFREPSAKAK